DRQSLYNLGVALCSQGKCREGVKRLLDADKADPGKAPVLQAIASAYRSLGNRREAANWEKRAQEASAAQGKGGGP
ncbi:MAG TPA: hypothetical protein VNI57_03705, partial [Candidatus Saccharimonadales bacterium]|nr:hypothetical protein [Candidatus Saccharimonadales bacterium]